MQNIPNILQQLADIGSTNTKKEILAETKSELLSKIFKQAYDPFITFGTVKIDTSDITYNEDKVINDTWINELFELLNQLEKRELTGNKARDVIKMFMEDSPEAWGTLVHKILKKDLRIGAGKRLINKVYDNLFQEDVCMGASKYNPKKNTFPVYADAKLDGIRCIASINNKSLISRNGKEFKNYPTILKELEELNLDNSVILDGEIMMGDFQNLMKTVSRKEDGIELAKDAVYNIFDIILLDKTLEERNHELNKIIVKIEEKGLKHIRIVIGKLINTEEELLKYYNEQLKKGYEGIMIKQTDGVYEFKRRHHWMKMKPEMSDDLEIVGVEVGSGKYENILGNIVCKLPNGSTVNVGSGFKDDQRQEYWDKRDELIGMIAEVKYQEKTNDGSLRFPVFIRFRPDK